MHTSHGIMLQEVGPLLETPDVEDVGNIETEDMDTTSIMKRSKSRSVKLEYSLRLSECYVTQKQSPSYTVKSWTCAEGEISSHTARTKDMLWILVRLHSSKTEQQLPGWSGFVSATGEKPKKKTTIDYYPVINCPITEYRAVKECLKLSEEATKEVGQRYTITTFDLGVCMKAYPLIWRYPEVYKDHIIMVGSFHVMCAFFKMIGKKMACSGLSDVLIEGGLTTSGSIQAILSGKQYNRAVICHKTMVEALERLLLKVRCNLYIADPLLYY